MESAAGVATGSRASTVSGGSATAAVNAGGDNPSGKRLAAVAGGVLLLIVLGIGVAQSSGPSGSSSAGNAGSSDSGEQANDEEQERKANEGLQVAFSEDELNSGFEQIVDEGRPSCEGLLAAVETDDYENDVERGQDLDAITDPREAAAARTSIAMPDEGEFEDYVARIERAADTGLQAMFNESDRDDSAPAEQITRWSEEWLDYALDRCDLTTMYDEITSAYEGALRAVDRFETRAASVPWYPEGFSTITNEVAVDWVPGAGNSCYGCVYWTLDVVSKQPCSTGLYVEINIAEKSSGRVVDWTNDTLPYLDAYQVGRLQFEAYLSGRGSNYTAEVVDVRC